MKKMLFVLVSMLVLACSCITIPGNTPAGVQPPVISSFSASPAAIQPGGNSTLSWSVTGATTVTIDNGIGNVALNGTRAIAPASNTTYVLTASGPAGSSTATTQVIVSGPSTPSTPAGTGSPVINAFNASPDTISSGASSNLNWSVSNATSVNIDQGIGAVAATGSRMISPGSSTIYTLTATNSSGYTTASTQVAVISAAPPPSISLPVINAYSAASTSILRGGSTTLSWNVTGASQVTISGLGAVSPVGSQVVSPSSTTTYTLQATNSAGAATGTVTISVTPLLLIPLITVVYDFIANAATANWQSTADLPFPGTDTDNRGFALLRNNVTLEDNNVYTQALETHPQWITGGTIHGAYTGMYPGYQVQSSDHFYSQIGFIKGASAGNVKFRVMIRATTSGNVWIAEVNKTYNGALGTIDIPLSAYAGQKADFILEVDANNPNATQDWAVWVNTKISR